METKEYTHDLKAILVSYLTYRIWLAIVTYGILAIYDFIKYKNTRIVLSSDSFGYTATLFSSQLNKQPYKEISDVESIPSKLNGLVNFGKIRIVFTNGDKVTYNFISNPNTLRAFLIKKAGLESSQDNSKSSQDKLGKVIGNVNPATLKEVKASCRPNEEPIYIIGDGITGSLAIFEDRCLIIKKGMMTSFMAGSFGGGRVATFNYMDITGIEYNTGIMTGILEILTPSYSGKSTNSVWTFNNDNSAYNSSNTLPWDKIFYAKVRPQIEELKHMISDYKRRQR